MRLRQHPFNLVERERAPQLDGEGLAVTTHRAYPDAYPVHRNLLSIPTKNLVCFRVPLPFFAALAITEVFVDPRQQAGGQGLADILLREPGGGARAVAPLVDAENPARRIIERAPRALAALRHLRHELAHVGGARAGSRLVGHGSQPLVFVALEKARHAHEHEAHGAVATDVILNAF